ncbi:MAG TPA: MFS transporter [Syntrophorhabdaceae bacterium]|nr:MFS transporter [Syntrophorhabdaceae bacterium]
MKNIKKGYKIHVFKKIDKIKNLTIPFSFHYAWVIAFTGTVVVLLAHGFGRMSYSIILPSMKEGIGLTYTESGLIGTGNFIGYLFLCFLGGSLAVRFGSRKIIFVSLIVMGLSLFATGLSNSFITAFLMRLITGMGNGSAYIPMLALPALWFSKNKRGLATGIITMGTGIGLFLNGVLLPPIIGKASDGWRYAWFTLGVILIVTSFFCYALLRDNLKEMNTTMYGEEEFEKRIFNIDKPLATWIVLIKEIELWKLGLVYFMYGISYIVFLTFFVAYLTGEIGYTYKNAGKIFATFGLCSIISGVIWGWISDIFGRNIGLFFASFVLACSYVLSILWKNTLVLYASAIIFGLTISSIPTIMAAAAGDVTGGKLAPAALGFITLFFGIGQCIGPGIAGWLKDITGSFMWSFGFSSVASCLGGLCSILFKGSSSFKG